MRADPSAHRLVRLAALRRRRSRGARIPVRVVRPLLRRGKPRALGRDGMVPDLRDAQLGEDARLRHRGAAAGQRRSRDARRRTFPQRLRLLSRRAGRADQSDRASHAAAAARSRHADAAVARPRAVLDRQERHQVHRHAGLGGAAARRRGLGAGRVPAPPAVARRAELSRPRARRPAESRNRAGARSRRAKPRPARSAPARAATATSAMRRRARWCRSCTASRPSS